VEGELEEDPNREEDEPDPVREWEPGAGLKLEEAVETAGNEE
jgi:hypothetical protein